MGETAKTARGKAGFVSLGTGMIAVPIASMIYAGLAWMTVVAMTACVAASLLVCLAGRWSAPAS